MGLGLAITGAPMGPGSGGDVTFDQLVLRTQRASLLAYWDMTEITGTTVVNAAGNTDRNGAYVSATLANSTFLDGLPVPLFPGSPAGRANVYSASLRDAMNFDEGTLMLAYKPQTASVWSDTTTRRLASFLTDATAARLIIESTGSYALNVTRIAGGTKSYPRYTSLADWLLIFFTWSVSGSAAKFVVNGCPITTLAALNAATGQLNSVYACIGAYTGTTGINPSKGWFGRAALWSAPLSDGEMLSIWSKVKPTGSHVLVIGDSKSSYNAVAGLWVDNMVTSLTALGTQWLEWPPRQAIGGYDVGEMDTYLQANLSSLSGTPDIILVSMGANDAPEPTPEATFKAQLTSIIDQLRTAYPGKPICVSKPWRADYSANCATLAGHIDAVLATYASGVSAGPNENVWLENGDGGATYTSDGIHYNVAGAAECAAQWVAALGY